LVFDYRGTGCQSIHESIRCDSAKLLQFGAARIKALYKGGKNVSQIVQALGYPAGTGNNRVRNALIKAGVYKPASK